MACLDTIFPETVVWKFQYIKDEFTHKGKLKRDTEIYKTYSPSATEMFKGKIIMLFQMEIQDPLLL